MPKRCCIPIKPESAGWLIHSNRIKLDLSMKELGGLVGVSKQAICNWEHVINWLVDDNLDKLAKILKLDIDELRSLKPKRKLKQKPVEIYTWGGFLMVERLKRNLSIKQLTKDAGVKTGAVFRLEHGLYKKGSKALCRVVEQLLNFFKRKIPETTEEMI